MKYPECQICRALASRVLTSRGVHVICRACIETLEPLRVNRNSETMRDSAEFIARQMREWREQRERMRRDWDSNLQEPGE